MRTLSHSSKRLINDYYYLTNTHMIALINIKIMKILLLFVLAFTTLSTVVNEGKVIELTSDNFNEIVLESK